MKLQSRLIIFESEKNSNIIQPRRQSFNTSLRKYAKAILFKDCKPNEKTFSKILQINESSDSFKISYFSLNSQNFQHNDSDFSRVHTGTTKNKPKSPEKFLNPSRLSRFSPNVCKARKAFKEKSLEKNEKIEKNEKKIESGVNSLKLVGEHFSLKPFVRETHN